MSFDLLAILSLFTGSPVEFTQLLMYLYCIYLVFHRYYQFVWDHMHMHAKWAVIDRIHRAQEHAIKVQTVLPKLVLEVPPMS